MKDITVIVTAAGAPGAHGIIEGLRQVKERKINIVTTDMRLNANPEFIVPPGDHKDYVKTLLQIAKKTAADVILPLSDVELLTLSTHLNIFLKYGTRILVNDPASLSIARNKKKTYHFLDGTVPIPRYHLVHTFDELCLAAYNLGYPELPVCIKPPINSGQRGFRILNANLDRKAILFGQKPNQVYTTLEDLSFLSNETTIPELLVMEYLPGREYSTDTLAKEGRSLLIIPRERVETRLGISWIGITENNQTVREYCEKINKQFQFSYNINIQMKYSEDGIPKLVEINPRVSGTICLCTAAGVNLPYLSIKMALGEEIEIPKNIRWGIKMMRYWSELYA